jgi:RNA polymerase nonessential primary-like sigma factor
LKTLDKRTVVDRPDAFVLGKPEALLETALVKALGPVFVSAENHGHLEHNEAEMLAWVHLEITAESKTEKSDRLSRLRLEEGEKFPSLSLERLNIRRAVCGDPKAQLALVEQHNPIVKSVTRSYARGALSQEDLESDAHVAILESIERFDLDRGVRFVSFLQWRLKDKMQAAVSNQASVLTTPRRVLAGSKNFTSDAIDSAQNLGVDSDSSPYENEGPNDNATFGDDLIYSHQPVPEARNSSVAQSVGLETIAELEDDSDQPDQLVARKQQVLMLAKLWDGLKRNEREVLELHFGLRGEEPMSLTEIAESLGVTRQRAGQILKAGLSTLEAACNAGSKA